MSDAPRLSELLTRLVDEHPSERLYPAELMDALADRASGAMLLLFALINILPLPPGVTAVTGIPVVIVAAQMMIGKTRPWLPKWIMRRSVTKEQAKSAVGHLARYERWVGKITKPRLAELTNHRGAQVIGAISLLLGVIVTLPIPLGNHVPALAMTLFGMALVNRDGATALVGGAVAIGALVLVSSVIGAAILAARYFLTGWFA